VKLPAPSAPPPNLRAPRHIPVIILSNYGEPELRERGLKLGALEFLVKADTTPAQLSTRVERSTGPRGELRSA